MQLQLYVYLLVSLLSLALASPTPPSLKPCPPSPHPTLAQHRLAYTTFCTRHFTPLYTFTPNKKLVFTYRLADVRGKDVYWVLSAMWEQGAFLGGGTMEVGVETCLEWFQHGEGEGVCGEKDGREGVRGWRGKRGGVRIEARRRGG